MKKSAQAIRKRWDEHVRTLDAQLESEGEASKCVRDNVTKPQDVDLEIDGIEVKTKARVVIHGNFNEGIVLGKEEELRCWNVRSNEVGVACLDDDSSLTVDFPLNRDVVSAVTMKGLVRFCVLCLRINQHFM